MSINFRSVLLANAVAGSLIIPGMAAAEAATVSGEVSLYGTVNAVTDASDNTIMLDFSDSLALISEGGLSDVSGTANVSGLIFINGISQSPLTAFIDFGSQTINGTTANLLFNLTAPVELSEMSSEFSTSLEGSIEGAFEFDGTTLATGTVFTRETSLNTYQIEISTEPVPEPLTILGSGAALSMGAFLKRRKAKAA